MIRKATKEDAGRLAEILIFTKRACYRKIFRNDEVSFNEMQVVPLAKEYSENEKMLEGVYVYDDGIVKGLIHVDGDELKELYVDWFFHNESVGSKLIEWAKKNTGIQWLWALEKNEGARRFYNRHGFMENGERKLEEGTPEYLVKLLLK